jgi:hypothetical protein
MISLPELNGEKYDRGPADALSAHQALPANSGRSASNINILIMFSCYGAIIAQRRPRRIPQMG